MGTITNTGLEYIAKNLNGLVDSEFTYIAIGTDSTAESTSNTSLGAENTTLGAARKQATCAYTSPGTASFNALFSFSGNVTVREVGIFDAPSGGHLLYRRVLAANRNYSDGDAAEFTVTIPFTRA